MKPEDVFAELWKALAGKLLKTLTLHLPPLRKVYLNTAFKGYLRDDAA